MIERLGSAVRARSVRPAPHGPFPRGGKAVVPAAPHAAPPRAALPVDPAPSPVTGPAARPDIPQ